MLPKNTLRALILNSLFATYSYLLLRGNSLFSWDTFNTVRLLNKITLLITTPRISMHLEHRSGKLLERRWYEKIYKIFNVLCFLYYRKIKQFPTFFIFSHLASKIWFCIEKFRGLKLTPLTSIINYKI